MRRTAGGFLELTMKVKATDRGNGRQLIEVDRLIDIRLDEFEYTPQLLGGQPTHRQ
jgi:hypothetical protein